MYNSIPPFCVCVSLPFKYTSALVYLSIAKAELGVQALPPPKAIGKD
jgi:hypothetical protein